METDPSGGISPRPESTTSTTGRRGSSLRTVNVPVSPSSRAGAKVTGITPLPSAGITSSPSSTPNRSLSTLTGPIVSSASPLFSMISSPPIDSPSSTVPRSNPPPTPIFGPRLPRVAPLSATCSRGCSRSLERMVSTPSCSPASSGAYTTCTCSVSPASTVAASSRTEKAAPPTLSAAMRSDPSPSLAIVSWRTSRCPTRGSSSKETSSKDTASLATTSTGLSVVPESRTDTTGLSGSLQWISRLSCTCPGAVRRKVTSTLCVSPRATSNAAGRARKSPLSTSTFDTLSSSCPVLVIHSDRLSALRISPAPKSSAVVSSTMPGRGSTPLPTSNVWKTCSPKRSSTTPSTGCGWVGVKVIVKAAFCWLGTISWFLLDANRCAWSPVKAMGSETAIVPPAFRTCSTSIPDSPMSTSPKSRRFARTSINAGPGPGPGSGSGSGSG